MLNSNGNINYFYKKFWLIITVPILKFSYNLANLTDTTNTAFQLASDFVNYTNLSLFLTGKAGTGKTTFLKHIKENEVKNTVVVAPTGVAAINA